MPSLLILFFLQQGNDFHFLKVPYLVIFGKLKKFINDGIYNLSSNSNITNDRKNNG